MRIFSIFKSISGELGLFYPGSPTIFVRFAGCPLNCDWCDTLPAIPKDSGQDMTVDEVLDRVRELSVDGQIRQVLITGGEPLLQKPAFEELVARLKAFDGPHYSIQVETSGACLPSKQMCAGVDWWVVDCKLPSSGEPGKMKLSEFDRFAPRFSIKFPCRDRGDFDSMLSVYQEHQDIFSKAAQILLSPVNPLSASTLLRRQEEAASDNPWLRTAMLNVQLHKLLRLTEDQGGLS